MWVLQALIQLVVRVTVALGITLLVALLIALLRGGEFGHSFGIACLVIGCISLLMAPAGNSPAMRMGVNDPFLASFVPGVSRYLGASYGSPQLNPGIVFFLTGVVLIALGLYFVG